MSCGKKLLFFCILWLDVLQVGESGSDGSLSRADHPPESQEILFRGTPHPGGDAPAQDALYCAGVEVPEHPEWEFKVSQSPEVTLTGVLHRGVYVVGT